MTSKFQQDDRFSSHVWPLRILVKLPTRGRPKQCAEVIRAMQEKQSGECTYLVSLDTDDPEFDKYGPALEGLNAIVKPGTSRNKIHAINRDIKEHGGDWDILVVASDDMWPIVQGWDEVIRQDMGAHYPSTDGMLWYNDGYANAKLNTMPIMGRAYFSRFGYVYHPSYRSFFCDDEQTEVAKAHGKVKYIPRQLFDHRHPDNRVPGVKSDDTYQRAIPHWHDDEMNYRQRRLKGFPL